MSDTNMLIPIDTSIVSKYANDEVFNKIATSRFWLPYLQLVGSNSKLVQQGKVNQAHYVLVLQKDQFEDLGKEVDVLPIDWRPKAMKMTPGGTPISYFDPNSEEFLEVQERSETPNSGCMFGPEFLLWIPAVKRFSSYFMSSKTSRNRAPELRTLLGRGATLKTKLIETKQFRWHSPTVFTCASRFEVPSNEEVQLQRKMFCNPETSTVDFEPEKLENDDSESEERIR